MDTLEFKNGSVIKTIKGGNNTRSARAKMFNKVVHVDIDARTLSDLIICFVDPSNNVHYNSTIEDFLDALKQEKDSGTICSFPVSVD